MSTEDPQQTGTLLRLIAFSLSLAIVPIASYFTSQHLYFPNDSIIPAIIAVLSANVILVGYVVVAVREDISDQKSQKLNAALESKKSQ